MGKNETFLMRRSLMLQSVKISPFLDEIPGKRPKNGGIASMA